MGLFTNLRVYAGKWEEKDSQKISAADIAEVEKAEVVPSQYGNSVCFYLKRGGQTYIPLSRDASATVGEDVTNKLAQADIITLGKAGELDIQRIRV